jgi:hypothetical protein
MAKKSSGKTYTSKGIHSNVSSGTLAGMRRDRNPADKVINIQKAWLANKNPWVTIENPNKEQKNKPFIRVRANELWGNPKERDKKMFMMPGA